MGVMCLVWRYRLVVSIILVVALCDVFASDAQPIGKVYPRGNHWAVGHLMGKKSTDEQVEPEDPEADDVTSVTPDQDLQLERANKQLLPLLLYAHMRGRMTPESMQEIKTDKLVQRILTRWEEVYERIRQDKQVKDFIQRTLSMQDDNES